MRITLLLLVFLIIAISCKKDPETPPHEDSFSASVNGTAFLPANIKVLISGSASPGSRAINVYAANINGLVLSLHMYEYNGIKTTFNLDPASGSLGAYCLKDCDYFFSTLSGSKTGEIKITSFDKTTYKEGEVITATFQFETDDTVGKYSITNGHFSVLVPN
jgi:hypothetical protein